LYFLLVVVAIKDGVDHLTGWQDLPSSKLTVVPHHLTKSGKVPSRHNKTATTGTKAVNVDRDAGVMLSAKL